MDKVKAKALAKNNDLLRTTLGQFGGEFVVTPGIQALSEEDRQALYGLLVEFTEFDADNDPYGEHDFGKIEFKGVDYFFKIDNYRGHENHNLVMTLMRADEY